jgi:hypothetical protein
MRLESISSPLGITTVSQTQSQGDTMVVLGQGTVPREAADDQLAPTIHPSFSKTGPVELNS